MPPVLDVALRELAAAARISARATVRLATVRANHVLELVAESIGAAGLIEGGAGPHATGERRTAATVEHSPWSDRVF